MKLTNMKTRLSMFALFIVLGAASNCWATVYYVSSSGSDTNNGTSTTTPYKTIQNGLNRLTAGDTLNIMAGTYYETLVLKNTGTSAAPITVQNYNGGAATINSGSQRAVVLGATNGAINYYTFKGLTFVSLWNSNANYTGNKNTGSSWTFTLDFSSGSWWGNEPLASSYANVGNNGFVIQDCNITGAIAFTGHNNTVSGCNINGKDANGTMWTDGIFDTGIMSHDNLVTGNTIHDFSNRAFHSMTNTWNDTVTYNTIYNVGSGGNGGAIDFDGEYLAVTGGKANYNTVYNCSYRADDIAIQFENGINGQAIGNTIYNCANGIFVINYGSGYQEYRNTPTNILIANNVIANTSQSAISLNQSLYNYVYNNSIYNGSTGGGWAINMSHDGTAYTASGNIVENNIIANSAGGIQALTGGNYVANTIQNNLFYGNSNNGTSGTSVKTGNPQFTAPTATPPDLSTQSGSAAINAGRTISAVPADIAGTPRPQGSVYDIGAYEFYNGNAIAPPSNLNVM